jgi:hypothetical protein
MASRSDERPTGRSRETAAQRATSGSTTNVGTVEPASQSAAFGSATNVGTVLDPLVVEAQMTAWQQAAAAVLSAAGTGSIAPGGAGGVSGAGQVTHEAEQSMLRDIDAILARIESGLASERAAMDALLKRVTRTAA